MRENKPRKKEGRRMNSTEAIQNTGEYHRGWIQGREDTMKAYGIKEAHND